MKRRLSAAAVAALLVASTASAGEAVAGLGATIDRDDHEIGAAALSLDYATGALATLGPIALRLGVAGEADTEADFWAGIGPFATLPVGGGFRLEGSVMAGAYAKGSGEDLGGPLIFRSRIGVSYAAWSRTRIGLAFEHKSNAGIHEDNPGIETLLVTVGMSY